MEFEFNINELFSSEITKLDHEAVRPERRNSRRLMDGPFQPQNDRLSIVIDRMGDASAQAQGLHGSITTYEKLLQSDHLLYVMKDEKANNKKGVIVGILKMGEKRLFLVDSQDNQHEMHPVCVLDFYIHESYQRKGCGKRLFEFMLKDKGVSATDLAIDRPSSKLLAFLNKHYHLSKPIHQRNHFTVYEGIFPKTTKKEETDIHAQLWGKGRYSDPGALRGSQETEMPRAMSRRSYPPSTIQQSNSSVASVVFGQPFVHKGQNEHDSKLVVAEEKHFRPQSLVCQEQHRVESKDYSENRSGIDSSLNVFGIPSPANRPNLDVRQCPGSSLHEDRQALC